MSIFPSIGIKFKADSNERTSFFGIDVFAVSFFDFGIFNAFSYGGLKEKWCNSRVKIYAKDYKLTI
ncbi:hypothetical protein GCM10023184_45620 [Flaviaesturariibacter amylovorans]|uniref:Uncharacterized protein n=1 Tax=Flaviaesturariibacter amylovorans TaxID=1084520 RepID=A0ABP8HTX6_9BACT